MEIFYNLDLNVSTKNVINGFIVKQKDSNSRYVNCRLWHRTKQLIVSQGSTVVVNAARANGEYRSFAGTVNNDGSVRFLFTNWMLEEAGILSCSITVYESEEKLTSTSFDIEVEKTENPTGTVSPDDPYVDLAKQLADECEGYAERAEVAAQTAESSGVLRIVFDMVEWNDDRIVSGQQDQKYFLSPEEFVKAIDENRVICVMFPHRNSESNGYYIANSYSCNVGNIEEPIDDWCLFISCGKFSGTVFVNEDINELDIIGGFDA